MCEEKTSEFDSEEILNIVFDLVVNFSKLFTYSEEGEKLKTMEYYLLIYIALKGPQKMKDLAHTYSMTKSNITFIVDDLEKKGLLKRERSKNDRRVYLIMLTAKGKKHYKNLKESFDNIVNRFLEKVPSKDLNVITDGFIRMARFVNDNKFGGGIFTVSEEQNTL
ncbi:MAG: MarR family winged helix-turn-helix transcriptional regulator [Petrotogales bacterium]